MILDGFNATVSGRRIVVSPGRIIDRRIPNIAIDRLTIDDVLPRRLLMGVISDYAPQKDFNKIYVNLRRLKFTPKEIADAIRALQENLTYPDRSLIGTFEFLSRTGWGDPMICCERQIIAMLVCDQYDSVLEMITGNAERSAAESAA